MEFLFQVSTEVQIILNKQHIGFIMDRFHTIGSVYLSGGTMIAFRAQVQILIDTRTYRFEFLFFREIGVNCGKQNSESCTVR